MARNCLGDKRGTVEADNTDKIGRVAGVPEHRIDVGVARVKTNHLSRELVLRIVNE